MLRRLEEKGYVTHSIDGRTYVYEAAEPRRRIDAKAVQRIVGWICNGSAEEVVVVMINSNMVDRKQLRMLVGRIDPSPQGGRK